MTDERPELLQEPEVLDGVPVLAGEVCSVEPLRTGALVPTAAVVGVSVMAGAAAVAIVHRRRARRLAHRRRRMIAPVLAGRSFLVDVHVLGERK